MPSLPYPVRPGADGLGSGMRGFHRSKKAHPTDSFVTIVLSGSTFRVFGLSFGLERGSVRAPGRQGRFRSAKPASSGIIGFGSPPSGKSHVIIQEHSDYLQPQWQTLPFAGRNAARRAAFFLQTRMETECPIGPNDRWHRVLQICSRIATRTEFQIGSRTSSNCSGRGQFPLPDLAGSKSASFQQFSTCNVQKRTVGGMTTYKVGDQEYKSLEEVPTELRKLLEQFGVDDFPGRPELQGKRSVMTHVESPPAPYPPTDRERDRELLYGDGWTNRRGIHQSPLFWMFLGAVLMFACGGFVLLVVSQL